MIKPCFPYDKFTYLMAVKQNAITFVIPSNSKLNVEPTIEVPKYILGFNRSDSKINNVSLMQSLNVSSLTDDRLQILGNKIPEMKCVNFYYK